MKPDQDIQDLLQGQFDQFEADPDRDLWPEIEAELRPRQPRSLWGKWGRYAAVAASVLLLVGLAWLLRQPQPLPAGQVAETPVVPPSTTAPATTPAEAPPSPTDMAQAAPVPLSSVPTQPAPAQVAPAVVEVAARPAPPQPMASPPKRGSVGGVRAEALTPVHHQLAMRDRLTKAPAPEAVRATRLPTRSRAPQTQPTGNNRQIDLNKMTLANAFSLATEEFERWTSGPVKVRTDETPTSDVRTFEVPLINVTITRKVHKKTK